MSSVLVLSILVLSACSSQPRAELLGAYRLSDGQLVSVRRSADDSLRYRIFESGQSGRLFAEGTSEFESGPGFSGRSPVDLRVHFRTDSEGRVASLAWRPAEGPALTGTRIGEGQGVRFVSDGTQLEGRLDLPGGPGPFPAVVLVHGSGSQAATEFYANGDFLAPNGIATLTFDKRGTGASEGETTFDFHQLARDVVAAVNYLRSRPEIDAKRIGLCGYSQGGWVAPLAASLDPEIAFVVVSYGMIESPAEEARLETRNQLRKRGLSESELEEADRLTRVAVDVVARNFEDGWDRLREVDQELSQAPWREKLAGTVVGKVVSYPRWLVKTFGRRLSPKDLDWYYDSTELLETHETPMVWLLGEADESAPNELTLRTLERLEAQGRPLETILFPGADHGMLMFEEVEDQRIYTQYAERYFQIEAETVHRLSSRSNTMP